MCALIAKPYSNKLPQLAHSLNLTAGNTQTACFIVIPIMPDVLRYLTINYSLENSIL